MTHSAREAYPALWALLEIIGEGALRSPAHRNGEFLRGT